MATDAVPARLEDLQIDRRTRTRRPHKRRLLLLALALVALVIAAAVFLSRPPSVSVAQVREVRPGEQQTAFTASGFVTSRRQSILAPKIPGRLVEVTVNEGDRVKEGDVVARLEDSDAKVALERSRAELSAAVATLKERQAAEANAKLMYDRNVKLAESGAITPAALDDSRTALNTTSALRGAASARVNAARRATDAAELGLRDTVVRAPFDGTVVRKIADEGAVLAPATVTGVDVGGIIELVDLDALEVDAEVSEDQLRRVKPDEPTLIFLDAYPDNTWRGRAATVRPSVDKSRATATVKVRFEDPTGGVLPGMGARVAFLSQALTPEQLEAGAQLRIPAAAVVQHNAGATVFVVEKDQLKEVPVELGEKVGDEYVLRKGPAAGQQIVLSPQRRMRAGTKVKVATP